jgi:hypothetical protein
LLPHHLALADRVTLLPPVAAAAVVVAAHRTSCQREMRQWCLNQKEIKWIA